MSRKIKDKKSSIAIYIISRNYGKYLDQAIKSVINQSSSNWNLYLVNDGSTDETKKIMDHYKKKNRVKIFFINNKTSLGLQKNANKIIESSKDPIIMRLDADDWLENNAVQLITTEFKKDKKIDIVYGNYYYSTDSGLRISKENKIKLRKKINYKHFPPHGACTAFKRSKLRVNGGYNESFNAQDGWDIWHKLARKNNVIYINKPIFNYRQHANSLSQNRSKLLKAREKIFEFYSKKILIKNDNLLAIIPVKENYLNFKNVPFLKILNKNLLLRTIDSAINCKDVKKILITTKSQKVINYIKKLRRKNRYKQLIIFKRGDDEKRKYINLKKILSDACNYFISKNKQKLDYFVYLSIHSPFRTGDHIKKCFDILKVNKCDTVFSVQPEYDPIFKFTNNGLKLINPGRFNEINFERESLLKFNGSIILSKYSKNFNLFNLDQGYFEMTNYDSVQIKSMEDYNKMKKYDIKND